MVSTELYELLLHFLLGRDCNKQRSLLNERTIDVITTSNFLVRRKKTFSYAEFKETGIQHKHGMSQESSINGLLLYTKRTGLSGLLSEHSTTANAYGVRRSRAEHSLDPNSIW